MRRIFVHLWPHVGGGIMDADRYHRDVESLDGVGFNLLVGSPYASDDEDAKPEKILDGRIELGRPVNHPPAVAFHALHERNNRFSFDGESLALAIVAREWSAITRRQMQVAAQMVYLWKWENRLRLDRVLPSWEIEEGVHAFDMEEFRWIVHHWERSNRSLRPFPTSVA